MHFFDSRKEKQVVKSRRAIVAAPDQAGVPSGHVKLRVHYTDGSMSRESSIISDREYLDFKHARLSHATGAQMFRDLKDGML